MWSCAPGKWNLTESEILMWWMSLRAEHTEPPLPTFLHSRPNPKFNPKTKPNTNPIAADATYKRAARHPNRLRSPFCTQTRSSTAHQQQVHKKSYKWSVGFNVNGRTFRVSVIAVRPSVRRIEWHTYITSPQWRHARRRIQFPRMCVIHWSPSLGPRDGRVGSAPPPPTPPAHLSFRVGTDGQT